MRCWKPIFFVLLLVALTSAGLPVGAQSLDSVSAVSPDSGRLVLIEVNGDYPFEKILSTTVADLIRKAVPDVSITVDVTDIRELNSPQVVAFTMAEDITMLGRNPSLIIFVGAGTWLEYKSIKHSDIPALICDVPDTIPVSINGYYDNGCRVESDNLEPISNYAFGSEACGKIFAVAQETDHYANLRLIKSLYPDISTIYYYSDGGISDEYEFRHLRNEAADNFGTLKIADIRRGTMRDEKLVDSLRKCSEEGVVLMREAYPFLADSKCATFSKPVFTLTDSGESDYYSLGGVKISSDELSRSIADAALKMLGPDAPSFGSTIVRNTVCKMNSSSLARYGLDRNFKKSDFFKDTVFYNTPESFFRHYIVLIFILVLFIAMALVLISAFIFADVNSHKSKKLIGKFKELYEYSILIYNNMPIPLVQYAADGKVLKATPSAFRLFDANPELRGLSSNCFDNPLVAEMSSHDSKVRSGFDKTVKLMKSKTAYRLIFNPIVNEGKSERYLLIMLESTKLERERNRLSYLSDGFVFSMNQIGVGVVEFGPDQQLLFSTDPWFNLFGVSRIASLRSSFDNLFVEDRETVLSYLDKVGDAPGVSFAAKVRMRYAQDKFHWLEVRFVSRVTEEGYHVTMGMARNIDKDMARADAIRASLDAAKTSGLLKSKFVANMSHEIKTPLNAIVGFTDLLTSSEDPQEKQMYAHFISENNNSLLELIDSILNIPSTEGRGMVLNKENFDLNDLLEEIAYSTRMSVDPDKIKVSFVKPYDSMVIYQDRNKLKEAISNLSGNSAKYTKQGGITLDYSLDSAGWLTIMVSDTGIGITDEDQKNIFRRYVRVGETDAEGHGLGLSIIQQIVTAMGGIVGVRSKFGEGSTFWIKIKKEVKP